MDAYTKSLVLSAATDVLTAPAVVAVAELPVQELDEPLILPVKYPTTFALIVDGNFKVTLLVW